MKNFFLTICFAFCSVFVSFAETSVTTLTFEEVNVSSNYTSSSLNFDSVPPCTVSVTKTFTDSNGDKWSITATGTSQSGDCSAAFNAANDAIKKKIAEM